MTSQQNSPANIGAEALYRSADRLRRWLERQDFAGVEPHDALMSPLLARTPLGRSRLIRLAALQSLRRLPLNPRRLLGIHPQVNAISLGWALKAYCLIDDEEAHRQIDRQIRRLRSMCVEGYSGACWGYYFPWQTRQDMKPANIPIVVSTAFIGSGLLDVYQKYGRGDCLELARSACSFILKDLRRTDHGEDGFCFSYTPHDSEQVYNASILAAALLARTGELTGEQELKDVAGQAVRFVVGNQWPDGSWGYAHGDRRTFIDNFHTGYVLDALDECARALGRERCGAALERGWQFYRAHFFTHGAVPGYYHDRLYPVDAHAVSQSIVTLTRFGDVSAASRVAAWAVENMQTDSGYFIYRLGRSHRNRIAYLRWSNVWMFYALRLLGLAIQGNLDKKAIS